MSGNQGFHKPGGKGYVPPQCNYRTQSSFTLENKFRDIFQRLEPWRTRKGAGGRVAVYGGSHLYVGAPYFAAQAAKLMGIDLVFVKAGHASVAKGIKAKSCDIMCAEYDDPNDYKAFTTEDREILAKCDCLIIGPGLGRGEEVKKMLRELLADETIWPPTKPLVIDADGLYAMTAPDASLPPPPSARGGKPADKWSADKETMDLFWNLLESRKILQQQNGEEDLPDGTKKAVEQMTTFSNHAAPTILTPNLGELKYVTEALDKHVLWFNEKHTDHTFYGNYPNVDELWPVLKQVHHDHASGQLAVQHFVREPTFGVTFNEAKPVQRMQHTFTEEPKTAAQEAAAHAASAQAKAATQQAAAAQAQKLKEQSAANGGGDGKITKSGSFDIPPEQLGKEHINPELQPDNVIEQQYKHKPKNFTGAVGNGYGGVEHPSTATTDNAGQDAADNQVALEMEAKQLNSVVVEKQLHHQPESAVKIEVNPFQAEGKGEKKKKVAHTIKELMQAEEEAQNGPATKKQKKNQKGGGKNNNGQQQTIGQQLGMQNAPAPQQQPGQQQGHTIQQLQQMMNPNYNYQVDPNVPQVAWNNPTKMADMLKMQEYRMRMDPSSLISFDSKYTTNSYQNPLRLSLHIVAKGKNDTIVTPVAYTCEEGVDYDEWTVTNACVFHSVSNSIGSSPIRAGGLGDVLSGVIGALFAWHQICLRSGDPRKQMNAPFPEEILILASYIVRKASQRAFLKKCQQRNYRTFSAEDVLAEIAFVCDNIYSWFAPGGHGGNPGGAPHGPHQGGK